MNTLALAHSLVHPALGLRIVPGIGFPAAAAVHRVFGILIVIVAVLIMLTAETGRRPRAWAMIFALALLALVATGCSAPAAATGRYGQLGIVPVGWASGAGARVGLIAVALAGLLFLAAVRLLLLVFGPVARMLHIVTALAQAVVVIGLAVVVLLLLAAG